MMATNQSGRTFWTKRSAQILASIIMGTQLLLLLGFSIDLLTRAIPYNTVILMGAGQGLLLVLLGLLYLRWSQIIWPLISRWQITHGPVSKLGAAGFVCFGLAVSLWFFLRFRGLGPSNVSYGLALALLILGLILFSFGVRQGLNSQARNS